MAKLSDPLVQDLLRGRYIATLGTQSPDGSVHLVAVWYLFDGDSVYVATASRSRKARNVKERAKASLMIDGRDPAASRGVTVSGSAQLLNSEASRGWIARIYRKYLSEAAIADPRVGGVFAQLDDVAIQIKTTSVVAWDLREVDKQAFGGALASNPGYLLPVE